MTLDEMRQLDAVKTYKELEESKAEIERLRKANFQLREGAEEQKQRIKRLEQAGDAMTDVLVWSSGTQYKRSPTASEWRKAKEAKP